MLEENVAWPFQFNIKSQGFFETYRSHNPKRARRNEMSISHAKPRSSSLSMDQSEVIRLLTHNLLAKSGQRPFRRSGKTGRLSNMYEPDK